jgi:hypothetical protein
MIAKLKIDKRSEATIARKSKMRLAEKRDARESLESVNKKFSISLHSCSHRWSR